MLSDATFRREEDASGKILLLVLLGDEKKGMFESQQPIIITNYYTDVKWTAFSNNPEVVYKEMFRQKVDGASVYLISSFEWKETELVGESIYSLVLFIM